MLAVIPAGTDNDLAVHLDVGRAEGAHILQALIGVFVAQQRAPELRLGRLHGDVDGADAQVDDALRLALGEVRERDVVAHEEAQARVIVLKIERVAHIRRHLIDKAEQAVVRAGARLVHQVGIKIEAEILALLLFDRQVACGPVGLAQPETHRRIVAEKAVVQHVDDLVMIDHQQLFAGADTGTFGGRACVDGCNDSAHALSPPLTHNLTHIV